MSVSIAHTSTTGTFSSVITESSVSWAEQCHVPQDTGTQVTVPQGPVSHDTAISGMKEQVRQESEHHGQVPQGPVSQENSKEATITQIPESQALDNQDIMNFDIDISDCPALGNIAKTLLLEHPWTLYFDTDWRFRHTISTMKTVFDLWGTINNVPNPSESPSKCNWSLFKNDIQPEWEDPHNKHGGKWNMDFERQEVDINKLWLYLLLGVVGETIDHTGEINGITLHLRPGGIRCAVWTAGTNIEKQKLIGKCIRDILDLPESTELVYKLQSEAIEKNSSYESTSTIRM